MTDIQSTDQNNESQSHTLMHYNARSFKNAFAVLVKNQTEGDTKLSNMLILPILFLGSHAVECYLKAFLLFKGVNESVLKGKYGHDLKKLYDFCQEKGLYEATAPEDCENRDSVIEYNKSFMAKKKVFVDYVVDKLSNAHHRDDDFSNRYLKVRIGGYLTTFDGLRSNLQELDNLLMSKLGNPRVKWTEQNEDTLA